MKVNRYKLILVFGISFSVLFLFLNANKANYKKVKLPSTLNIDFDTYIPEWTNLFDTTLCSGFKDPFTGLKFDKKIKNGSISYSLKTVSANENNFINEVWTCPTAPHLLKGKKIKSPGNALVTKVGNRANEFYLILEFQFLENGKSKSFELEISPLDSVFVKENQQIKSGEFLAISSLDKSELSFITRFEKESPFYKKEFSWYLKEYNTLTYPPNENVILVVNKKNYKVHLFKKGKHQSSYDICLGQAPIGHKEMEGDNKTPEGEYRITEREKGPFYGGTGPYLGDRWMHFSYPNRYDAEVGFKNGYINAAQRDDIIYDDKTNQKTNSYTKLGGRVGLHGWNGRFIANGTQDLTWGCVCMQNEDIIVLFDQVPMNTKLIIIP